MLPRWFIEDSVFNDTLNNDASNVQRVIFAAQELGCEVKVEKYRPFGGTEYNFFDNSGPVIFYGSLNACKDMQIRGIKWKPLAWNDWNKLRCASYYCHYGEHVLNNHYGMFPFGDLPRLKDFLFDAYGDELSSHCRTIHTVGGGDIVFIRPDENNKVFTGECVSRFNFDKWYQKAGAYDTALETICVVAAPRLIKSETRCIVADGKVVGHSLYAWERQTHIGNGFVHGALNFAEKMAAIWQPHPIFIIDVAQTYDGKFAVMEIGSVNCAGFYKCEIKPIVEAMTRISQREYDLGEA